MNRRKSKRTQERNLVSERMPYIRAKRETKTFCINNLRIDMEKVKESCYNI